MAAQEEQPQLQGADHGAALHFTVPPRISFQVTAGPCEGATLVPKGYSFSVGRTKASRLHIKDPSVSERHAEVSWDGSAWQVKDLGSSNGTKVDGVRVQPMGDAVVLREGSEVMFGTDSKCRVQLASVDLASCTIEQLLHCQHEVIAKSIEAQAQREAKAMLTEWGCASAELTAEA